jgi:hypothetical protein
MGHDARLERWRMEWVVAAEQDPVALLRSHSAVIVGTTIREASRSIVADDHA